MSSFMGFDDEALWWNNSFAFVEKDFKFHGSFLMGKLKDVLWYLFSEMKQKLSKAGNYLFEAKTL